MIAIGLFVFAILLISKLIYIQFYENKLQISLSPEALVKNIVLEPGRGNIYAADGNILATSVSHYELYWDAVTPNSYLFNSKKEALADSISNLVKISSSEILKTLEEARIQKNRYLFIDKNLSYNELKRYKSFPIFNENVYKGGLIVEEEIKRENPLGKIAERTIGYEKKDKDGTYFRVGLEGAFSKYLRGDKGLRLKQKIANGHWKPISDSNEKEPTVKETETPEDTD